MVKSDPAGMCPRARTPHTQTQRECRGACFLSLGWRNPGGRSGDAGLLLLGTWASAALPSGADALRAQPAGSWCPGPLPTGLHSPHVTGPDSAWAVKNKSFARDKGNDAGSCSQTNKQREKIGLGTHTRTQKRKYPGKQSPRLRHPDKSPAPRSFLGEDKGLLAKTRGNRELL